MKKIFKGIFLYLGVALISLFATAVLCAGFLFFYRDGNIFGFQYISGNNTIYAKSDLNLSATQKIEVVGKNFDIVVRSSDNVDNLIGVMKSKVFGYTRKSKNKLNFTLDYNVAERKAVFTIEEPTGWLSMNGSYVAVLIPTDILANNCQISISSNKGDITLGGDELIKLGDVSVQSNKGDFEAKNIEFTGAVTLNAGKGDFMVDASCKSTSATDFSVGVGSGRIMLNKIGDELEIDTISVTKITKGEIYILRAGELRTSGDIKGGGKITVYQVNSVNFESLDTDISIETIVGTENSQITSNGNGDTNITTSNCALLTVVAHNGDTVVENARGATNITANQGDISMPSATKYVFADSTYGNINITFNENAGEYSSEVSSNEASRTVVAYTVNGHITIKGLQNGSVTARNKGRIDLEYNKVLGTNVVTGASGNVNIIVPAGEEGSTDFAFGLKISGTEVNCNVKVGIFERSSSGATTTPEWVTIYANSSKNTLSVGSTTGVIKIRSKDLV